MFTRFRRTSPLGALAPVVLFFIVACSDTTAPAGRLHPTTAAFSGGVNSGGVNSGGGGGGGGGGGTTTPSTSGTCASLTTVNNSTGYYSVWAAIWTQFSFTSSCGFVVTAHFTYINGLTGNVDFARSTTAVNGTIDEDWASFSVPYTVTVTLTDPVGNVLDSRSQIVTTKVGKTAGA